MLHSINYSLEVRMESFIKSRINIPQMTNLLYVDDQCRRRAPALEQLTAQIILREYGDAAINVESAGTSDFRRSGISSELAAAISRAGYMPQDYHGFLKADEALLAEQDIVLCVDRKTLEKVADIPHPEKVHISIVAYYADLCENDIQDPIRTRTFDPHDGFFLTRPFKSYINRKMGLVSLTDETGIINLYVQMVKEIEKYARLVIKRMSDDGLIKISAL